MGNAQQAPAADTAPAPVQGRAVISTITTQGADVEVWSDGAVVVRSGIAYDGSGNKLVPAGSVKKLTPANDDVPVAPKLAPVLSGTTDEWKAEIKAKIAAKEIKAGDEVTDNAGRAWVYVEHLKSGKDFFAAKEDYVGEGGKEKFDHYDALEIAKKAGAQLMNLETGMISYKAFKKGILKNFKTDASYWLSDLYYPMGARTQWFDDGGQHGNGRRNDSRVRLALEM